MHTHVCPKCHGDGRCPDCSGRRDFRIVCQTCAGSGHCPKCQGAGVVETERPSSTDDDEEAS